MSALEKYMAAKKEAEAYQSKARIVMKEAFKECTSYLFDKYKDLQYFSWNQYTPFFNDGDECIFSVHLDDMAVKLNNDSDNDDDDYGYGFYQKGTRKHEIQQDIIKTLSQFSEDDFKEMFDDHCTVKVTEDNIETDECNHD